MESEILLIDSDPLVGKWLENCLAGIPGFRLSAHARSGAEAIASFNKSIPDVVILAVHLSDYDGFSLIEEFRGRTDQPKILFFAERSDDFTLYRLSHAPVQGIVWKAGDVSRHLTAALECLQQGKTYFPDEVRAVLARFRSQPDAYFKILSPREVALLPLFGAGLPDKQIAARSNFTASAARFHCQQIKQKLGLRHRWELIAWCSKKGFVSASLSAPPCEIGC